MTFARVSIASLVVALALAAAPLTRAGGTFKVDPVHSQVIFKVNHLGVSNVYGRFDDIKGTFVLDDDDATQSSFDVEIAAKSVDTNVPKRDDDLRSPDFFNVKQFPTISFKSTSVKKSGDNTYEVAGDLSLHGETKPITVTIEKIGEKEVGPKMGGTRAGVNTTFTIKRSDYGMTYMQGGVGDEITLMVNLEGIKQ